MLDGVQFGSLWRWNIFWCFHRPRTNKSNCSHKATSELQTQCSIYSMRRYLQANSRFVNWILRFYFNRSTCRYSVYPPCLVARNSAADWLYLRLRPRSVYPQTTSLTPVISTPLALSSDYTHPVFIFIYSLYESEEKGTWVKNKVVFVHRSFKYALHCFIRYFT